MINIIDDFLPIGMYDDIYKKICSSEFSGVDAGDRKFWVQYSNPEFDNWVINAVSLIERVDRQNILSFFRMATHQLDTNWDIHSDAIINGQRPERALVLYLSPSHMSKLHGTAFWKHVDLGDSLPSSVTPEMYDKILAEDSNNKDKWELQSVIGYKINRAVMYPCNYFHSKYPNFGWPGGRMVYVMFYK